MNKTLKDWTLGVVQEECRRRKGTESDGCNYLSCPFGAFCEGLEISPDDWDLTDTPTLTPDELAVCRLLKKSGVAFVRRRETTIEIAVQDGPHFVGQGMSHVFPSLRPGDKLDLTTMDLC